MTPEDIERAAIKAGMLAFVDCYPEADLIKRLTVFTRAYERAMWRPVEEARDDTLYLVMGPSKEWAVAMISGGIWAHVVLGHPKYLPLFQALHFVPTHFRPLPKPEDV